MAPLLTAVVSWSAGEIGMQLLSGETASGHASAEAQLAQYKALSGSQHQLGLLHASIYRAMALMASLDEAKVKALQADWVKQLDGVKRALTGAVDGPDADAQLRAKVGDAQGQLSAYQKAVDSAMDLASVDPNTGVAAMQAADTAFSHLTQTLAEMVARMDGLAGESAQASKSRSSRINLLMAIAGLLAASAAVTAAWRMQRKLVGELGRAADVANAVASGDLSVTAESERLDEAGELLRSLDRMTRQLRESMQTVFESSMSIQTASSEIATGNLDLSQRTEQTASNLQQTAHSMSELTGTVQQSAASAATANQLASNAAQVAERGGNVVGQVVSTMDEINASSKKIADIIGVIDSIAFQTNILALNAAVEAARAGEQGRGFAVVASEVRNLAKRSADAAREIKSLISASVDRVESGARLVQDAGSTMTEIVASVQRVTDIMAEIRASTDEQSQGIGRVNGAVGQLDQMTQQNAALVEQSAAAAESLKDQALKLSDVVGRFRLS